MPKRTGEKEISTERISIKVSSNHRISPDIQIRCRDIVLLCVDDIVTGNLSSADQEQVLPAIPKIDLQLSQNETNKEELYYEASCIYQANARTRVRISSTQVTTSDYGKVANVELKQRRSTELRIIRTESTETSEAITGKISFVAQCDTDLPQKETTTQEFIDIGISTSINRLVGKPAIIRIDLKTNTCVLNYYVSSNNTQADKEKSTTQFYVRKVLPWIDFEKLEAQDIGYIQEVGEKLRTMIIFNAPLS